MKANHDRLLDSDVSHQQKRKLNTPSMAQPTTGSAHVDATNTGEDVSASDGTNTNDDDDDSAEAEAEEDDKEPIAVAPPEDPSIEKDPTAGLMKDPARMRSAVAWKKQKLTGSHPAETGSSSRETSSARRTHLARTQRRGTKRASVGTAEGSDEDDYDAVDLISNSEEEEPEVEELEEKMIINSEEENEAVVHSPLLSTGPPSISSGGWEGFDLDDGVFLSDVPFFDEQISRNDPNLFNEVAIYNAATSFEEFDSLGPSEAVTTSTPRRVRFEEEVRRYSDSTSTDGSDEEDDSFPDLFMQQDSLDPSFRLMIENDNDEDDGHSLTDGESSYWDLKDQEELELERHGLNGDNSSSSCGSSSGYESGSPGSSTKFYGADLLILLSIKRTRATRRTKTSHLLPPLHGRDVYFEGLRPHPSVPKPTRLREHSTDLQQSHRRADMDPRWVLGLPTRINRLLSSTVPESEWSSTLHAIPRSAMQTFSGKPSVLIAALPPPVLVPLLPGW